MREITFSVEPCPETGGFVARWDDAPGRGGITTQADSLTELHEMIADAVNGYGLCGAWDLSFSARPALT